jgi:hypothetical protein
VISPRPRRIGAGEEGHASPTAVFRLFEWSRDPAATRLVTGHPLLPLGSPLLGRGAAMP